MLVSMTVHNIALIESLSVQFYAGMHVLTGETGAGKSIVVDSINLVLGERADRSLIRSGCEKASVEALIDISDSPQVQALLTEQGLEPDGKLISILREISITDRNICRICGVIMPLSFLRRLSSLLVDIHGQHEHQSLLDVDKHLTFLDSFGDDAHQDLIGKAGEAYHAWRASSARFSNLRKENARRAERQEYIHSRYKELSSAKLTAGEEEKLEQERTRYAGAEKIDRAVSMAYGDIYEGNGPTPSAMLQVKSAADAVEGIADLDPRFRSLADRLHSSYYELEEVGIELREIQRDGNFDPDRYERVQQRLDLYRKLERRYAMTSEELIAYSDQLKTEIKQLSSMDEQLTEAEKEYKAKLQNYRQFAALLTQSRQTLAARFEKLMENQLKDLGMERTHFEVVFHQPEPGEKRVPSAMGDDHIEFFIAPNPGEPLRPLSKTVSGGELSRLMLAMKAAAADRNAIPCMIFDEIDTGISGHVAGVVAEKMSDIAAYRQVICVTHLAQIAAMADTQYKVEKSVVGERTVTSLTELDEEGREMEIARLIGAADQNMESGLAHARSMLASAREKKQKMQAASTK